MTFKVIQGRWLSFRLKGCMPICHLLLVINSNVSRILHRLATITRTGLQGHLRSMISISSNSAYVIFYSNLSCFHRCEIWPVSRWKNAHFTLSIQHWIWKCFPCTDRKNFARLSLKYKINYSCKNFYDLPFSHNYIRYRQTDRRHI